MLVGRNWEDCLRSFDACFAFFNRGEKCSILKAYFKFFRIVSVPLEVENAILSPLCLKLPNFLLAPVLAKKT